ncbi:MAG: hypothetical protein ACI396_05795 [Acutalibacteraceae bacterium]
MNENQNGGEKLIVVDPNKGLKYVLAIALGIVAMNVFYTILDAVDGYSILGDIFGIVFSVVISLLILSGQSWMRFLFAGLCGYQLFFRIIYFIRVITGMRTNTFNLVVCVVVALFYVFCMIVLLVNKDVKAYFTPEQK